MRWDERIAGEFEPYAKSNTAGRPLADLIADFIQEQKGSWPLLRNGCEALEKIEARRLELRDPVGSHVFAQYNPGRIRSTAAAVDKTSVASRPCFLCVKNLPLEEKGIAYGRNLVITCNPFPVLRNHLSIIERNHAAQQIDGRVESLLTLARDLGPEYFVLYNGPRCGASAPDHFHLQACLRSGLPIEDDLRRATPIKLPSSINSVSTAILSAGARNAVVFHAVELKALASSVAAAIARLRGEAGESDEPMINIIAVFEDPQWTVFLFPRAKHRPASFYAEGNDRLLVSPGAIDMAGLIVMPDREEFLRITSEEVQRIFSEVSLDLSTIERAIADNRTLTR